MGRKYHSREAFLYDTELILENSKLYNGTDSSITGIARKIRDIAVELVQNVSLIVAYLGEIIIITIYSICIALYNTLL